MNKLFKSSEKIGEIVTRFPKAMEVFKEYNIDFCCGGDRPLSAALDKQYLNEGEVLSKLEEAYKKTQGLVLSDIDWVSATYSDLIDYVVNKHHAYMHKELPQLSELLTTILRVHGENHSELSKVYKLFHTLKMELDEHLIKEEVTLFPLIKEYEKEPTDALLIKALKVIKELESEHTGAGDILKELRKITLDYAIPQDVCNTFKFAYTKLEEMEYDLFQHIHLENNILFPRLEKERTIVFDAEVDVTKYAPKDKHPIIFSTFDNLKFGERMQLINDHDPSPLYYQFLAERPEQFEWKYLAQGPEVWRVAIIKL
jgi:regulator of cell morphogenesis and NO signaling